MNDTDSTNRPPPNRHRAAAAVATALSAAVVVLAGCSSSGNGTHTQSPPPSSLSPSSTGSSSSSSDPSPSPTTSWTPPAYGAARPAVDTYLKLHAASTAAFRAPAHASSVPLDKYLAGQARLVFDQALAASKSRGIAYKGTADTPRVTVVSASLTASLPEVVLHDCAVASATDPLVGYYVATGKPVASPSPKVAPPYAKTIKVFQPNRKSWIITSFTTDASKTCKP